MKRQTLNWKEVLSNHTCKGFVSHIYINSQNLTEKQTIQLKNGQKTYTDVAQKRICE